MRKWTTATEITSKQLLTWIGLWSSTFSNWTRSYGKAYEHNGWIPRDHWLDDSEKQAIINYHFDHPLEGYRRLTYRMLDADVVACSAGTVYRVLSQAGLLNRHTKRSVKGTGFQQPLAAHAHWHIDISYLNIAGTFYFMACVLDGYSRSVVHWDIREKMEEIDIEIILQAAREKFPAAKPQIISDNGPQFIAKDRGVEKFVVEYNTVRLHSAIASSPKLARGVLKHERLPETKVTSIPHRQGTRAILTVMLRRIEHCWEATRAPQHCR